MHEDNNMRSVGFCLMVHQKPVSKVAYRSTHAKLVMKCFLVLVCMLAVVAIAQARPYYHDLEIEEILGNPNQLVVYMKCMLGKGNCNSNAMKLNSLMKKALKTCCDICTETERNSIHKVIHHIINNERLYSEKIFAKYDPDSKCLPQYERCTI